MKYLDQRMAQRINKESSVRANQVMHDEMGKKQIKEDELNGKATLQCRPLSTRSKG